MAEKPWERNWGTPQQSGGVVRRPVDPYAPSKERRAEEDQAIERARLGISQDANTRAWAEMNKPPAGYRWSDNGQLEIIPGGPADPQVIADQRAKDSTQLTAEMRGQASNQYNTLLNLADGVRKLKQQYEANFKGKNPAEYLPATLRPENGVFDDTSAGLNAFIATALGLSGQQFNTPAEQKLFIGSILPSSGDTDAQIENKLSNLDSLIRNARDKGRAMLGYTDDNDPLLQSESFREYLGTTGQKPPAPPSSPATGPNIQSGGGGSVIPPDPRQQAEIDAFLAANPRGSLDPAAFNAFMQDLNTRYGREQGDYTDFVAGYNDPAARVDTQLKPVNVEGSGLDQFIGGVFDNSLGAGALAYGNAALGGLPGLFADDASTDAMRREYGGSMLAGDIAGGITGTLATGGLLGRTAGAFASPAVQSVLRNPLTADTVYGASLGATTADDPILGFLGGGAAGLAGGALGNLAGRGINAIRGRETGGLSRGENAVLDALAGGRGDAVQQLQQGVDLGVPLSLSDVSRPVNSLTGAAIRRNPEAAEPVINALTQRSAGQYDGMLGAIERDLGPVDNIPLRSEEIMRGASEAAGPLYQQAYSNPVISTPLLEDLLSRPFGRQALSRAKTIAANEGRDPMALGFALDEAGDVVLNPIPHNALGELGMAERLYSEAADALKVAQARQLTGGVSGGQSVADAQAAHDAALQALQAARTGLDAQPTVGMASTVPGYTTQTLDYTKRGMDDVLEQYRNPITNRLVLDEAGRAQNGVLRELLGEVDRLNPDYAAARSVYAGPAREKDALMFGQDALNLTPNNIGMRTRDMGESQVGQMQLGFQSALAENAGRVRNNSNPFSLLNSPQMEQRLGAVYQGGEDNIARLLAQRDMEMQAAGSANRLYGNSATAERLAADQAFSGGNIGADIATGAVETAITGAPVATALRSGLAGRVADMSKLGFGRRSEKLAEEILPLAGSTETADVIAQLLLLGDKYDAAQAINELRRQRAAQIGGAVGAGAATGFLPSL